MTALYLPGADADAADFPPLLAIVVRPLALLPLEAAASVWAILLGILGLPTIWAIVVSRDADPRTVRVAGTAAGQGRPYCG